MKSGKLNFLEPSGPLQASNGTALPSYPNVEGNRKIQLEEMTGPVVRNRIYSFDV
jgi:hypothetical protein